MITQKPKEKSLSVLIKEADKLFSEYVRLRDSDPNGYITCFVTGERVYRTNSDAAHYIDRRHLAVRYDEMNVHATTIFSNRYDQCHKYHYQQKMYEKYGVQAVYGLDARGKSLIKFTRSDLIEMIEDFKLRIKQLKR